MLLVEEGSGQWGPSFCLTPNDDDNDRDDYADLCTIVDQKVASCFYLRYTQTVKMNFVSILVLRVSLRRVLMSNFVVPL